MNRLGAIVITLTVAGLALAGGPPAEAGGGCHSDVFSDETNTQVQMSKNCFEPMVVRVQPGQQITWTSNDPEEHTVTGVAGTWGVDNKIHTGESATYQFDNQGVFPYFCFFHPSMVGAVVVGDGRAASASEARHSVKAVSAEAPRAKAAEDEPTEALEEDAANGVSTVPIIIGVGVLAAMGGLAGALVLRRKSVAAE